MADTSVRTVAADGTVARHAVDDLAALLADPGAGWLWLDVPEPDASTATLLVDVLGVHPAAAADGLARNHVARLHHYADVLYLALHRPCPGERGHVHYLELDLYVAPRFLVTLHGPRNPSVSLDELLRETVDVAARLDAGRLRPAGPTALAYSLVSALTNAQERIVNEFAQQVGLLEQRVMAQADDDRPQDFLDELFTVRHTLLTVRTMASQGSEVLGRAAALSTRAGGADAALLEDLHDQYHRLARITHSQLEFLGGVTDFYRARTDTRMLIAAERLAVIAAVTLPVAAVSGIFGMNLIVNDATRWWELAIVVAAMLGTSLWLLRWARRQGWW
ncbi:magnesium transporter CorA family protein [Phycicoccus sp. HDW14]|uniref:magnesium transporter CorA family protein n=1 Tax=Phycicoccus sp. HDW14 TaxID=2714941 RepID=UPI00140930A1|nr:magnesium transporter CorA family protein [Phycicoccus sp. HDW14]QIM20962.1 magnesium transporter CorA family protein [Phycicoccus sp. HDW14]